MVIMTHLSYRTFQKVCKLKPMAVADCVAIKDDSVLLVKRTYPPFKDMWCLPGGFMDNYETIEQTALRELKEETGATGKVISLIGVYSGSKRDPRCTTIDVAYLIEITRLTRKHDDESSEVKFFPINMLPILGFDHSTIVKDAIKILRKRKSRRIVAHQLE